MTTATTATKLDELFAAMDQVIKNHAILTEAAFNSMEEENISEKKYKNANREMGINLYVAGYLGRLKAEVSKNEPLKAIENRMRLHARMQRTKGNLSDNTDISIAQSRVAVLLEGFIAVYFES